MMKSMVKTTLITFLLLCVIILGAAAVAFADTSSDAAQPLKADMEYEIDGTKVTVEIESALVSKLDADAVYNLAEAHSKDSIKIISEDRLSQENLTESSELELYVYANKKLVQFQVDKASAEKLTVDEAKELIEDSANSDSNNVHVYDVGTGSSRSTTGYKVTIAAACVVILLMLGLQIRNHKK